MSDSPITLDKNRWKSALTGYRIEGRPVFDLAITEHMARLNEILDIPDVLQERKELPGFSTESRDSMLNRLKGVRLITDDNMGTEWKGDAH